jgi:hypothetical protein
MLENWVLAYETADLIEDLTGERPYHYLVAAGLSKAAKASTEKLQEAYKLVVEAIACNPGADKAAVTTRALSMVGIQRSMRGAAVAAHKRKRAEGDAGQQDEDANAAAADQVSTGCHSVGHRKCLRAHEFRSSAQSWQGVGGCDQHVRCQIVRVCSIKLVSCGAQPSLRECQVQINIVKQALLVAWASWWIVLDNKCSST